MPKKTAKKTAKKWSAKVTEKSDAMDIPPHVFTMKDPQKIAEAVKKAAEKSKRKKGTTLQSAMSALNFYLNRAGKNLTDEEKKPVEDAKNKLRVLFGRPEQDDN